MTKSFLFTFYRLPFTLRYRFTVYHDQWLNDKSLKIENCKLKIERRRRV